MKTYPFKNIFLTLIILVLAYFAGRGVAEMICGPRQAQETQYASSVSVLTDWPFNLDSPMLPGTENWGLGFGEKGAKPTGNASVA